MTGTVSALGLGRMFFRPTMLKSEESCRGSGEGEREETEGEFKTETMWFRLVRSGDPRGMLCKKEEGKRIQG